jgi:hypothetical protein
VNKERLEFLRRSKDFSDAVRKENMKARPSIHSRIREMSNSSARVSNNEPSKIALRNEALKISRDTLSLSRNLSKSSNGNRLKSIEVSKSVDKEPVYSKTNVKQRYSRSSMHKVYSGTFKKMEKKTFRASEAGKIVNKPTKTEERSLDAEEKVNDLTYVIEKPEQVIEAAKIEEEFRVSLPAPVINFDENSTEIEEKFISDDELSNKLTENISASIIIS